ncbi:hypothetical protein [Paenibacillus sp. 598K]|uniref:hypothetical protein n=1 Tax=Paenibacillus sp. 598K TaxID=1117987 RepID=UPI000FFED4A4|nr:hypothetical protein [Paenibacillus sp. 598K]
MTRASFILFNPIINVILLVVASFFVLNFNWAFTLEFIVAFSVIVVTVNALTFLFLYKREFWKYFFSNIGIFLSFLLLYLVYKITMGTGGSQGDQGNIAVGLVLLVTFSITLLSSIVGGLIGLVLNRKLKNSIKYK